MIWYNFKKSHLRQIRGELITGSVLYSQCCFEFSWFCNTKDALLTALAYGDTFHLGLEKVIAVHFCVTFNANPLLVNSLYIPVSFCSSLNKVEVWPVAQARSWTWSCSSQKKEFTSVRSCPWQFHFQEDVCRSWKVNARLFVRVRSQT